MWHTIRNSTPFTSSQEPEAAFSLTCYLDTIQSELAKSSFTLETSSCNDSETESCRPSPSGMMSAPLTASRGEDQLTFFAEDSPARTSVLRVKEPELPEHVRDFGRNMRDSLTRCGLDLSLPKTHLCFALGDLELSSKTWPRSGMMQGGELWELGMSVRPISGTECGSWPTPTVAEADKIPARANYGQVGLNNHPRIRGYPTRPKGEKSRSGGTQTPQTWPTPSSGAVTGGPTGLAGGSGNRKKLYKMMGIEEGKKMGCGQLNPSWVEWLMGWPIGWTDLKPLVTGRFRSVQQWHSQFSAKD